MGAGTVGSRAELVSADDEMYIHRRNGTAMNQYVKKWGNSLAVRIPASLTASLGLREDDPVEIREESGRLVVEKKAHAEPTLGQLLAGITPDNLHDETDWGPAVGKEIW
jgi:antitoxin MazE